MKYLYVYLIAAAIFLSIDMVWLTKVARGFYSAQIGDLLLEKPSIGAAVGFYLIFVGGLVYFAITPGLEAASLGRTVFNAGLFGMLCYMTYDMTNLATMKGFTPTVAVVDIVWGTVLCAVTGGATYLIARMLSLWTA